MRSKALIPGVLAVLTAALYLPFLSSPLFFDDRAIFFGSQFAQYATSPFGWGARYPAYFTIAAVHVLFGTIEAQRAVSAVLHCATALALFVVLRALQARWTPAATPQAQRRDSLAALAAAGLFAVHPVGVYAAGYLVQRSIVLATLFALLSLAVLVRGAASGKLTYALGAGALYAVAVLSKEHALLLPALALAALGRPSHDRAYYRYVGTYLAVCVPAAITAVLFVKGIIGERYEPDFGEVAAQISPGASDATTHPWAGSMVAQAALFFRYVALWIWPRTSAMAVDLRVDLAELWTPWVAVPALLAFGVWGGLAVWGLRRKGGATALAALGMLWFWLLFLVEFSTVRFQEPFVLYRSYLWAPGIAVILAAMLARIGGRVALALSACVFVVLAAEAHDRLRSLSSGLAMWEDAAAKLPAKPTPGGPRTLYLLGREYLNAGDPERAVAVIERCLREYPDAFQCPFARAAIHLRLEEYEAAIPYLQRARVLRPEDGVAAHHLGLALEQLGCRSEARTYYELAAKLGFAGAVHRIKAMDSPGQGLLPPAPGKKPPSGFQCPVAA
jgi:hypothetical protein